MDLIERMRLEIVVDELKVAQWDIGQPPTIQINVILKILQKELNMLCNNYKHGQTNITNFLKAILLHKNNINTIIYTSMLYITI